MKIKDLCCDEQPREKMLEKGPVSLSNAELLAILLRTGDGSHNAVEVSRDLLKRADESLCGLSDWSVDRLQEVSGIGPVKALVLAATFELARRWFGEKSRNSDNSIHGPEAIYRYIGPKLRSLSHEEAWMVLLNRANNIIGMEQLSTGGLTQTTMDARSIVRKALDRKATAVILVHNHPSGNPRPGKSDIDCTIQLKEALEAFDISLLDHLIVCDGGWFSFSEERVGDARGLFSDGR